MKQKLSKEEKEAQRQLNKFWTDFIRRMKAKEAVISLEGFDLKHTNAMWTSGRSPVS